jgi:site-specific DNA recombinase
MGRKKTPKQATLDATTATFQDNVGLVRSTTSRSRKLGTSERRALSRNPQTAGRGAAPAERKGALLYGRVSSDDSAESNLSIPDQLKKLRKFCEDTDRQVRHVYVDEGISAYLQVIRPQFEQMIADVLGGKYPDVSSIVVFAMSRFFRRSADFAIIEQQLNAHGVEIISITQTFSNDSGGFISKRITTMFDEYHSIQTSIHVKRSKREMAHQGYWPGGVPRHGFRLVPADNGRNRIEVDEVEEVLVKKVFHLAEYGDGDGPMGVKAIVNWTQRNGVLTRYGAPFSMQAIHRMLTFEGYNGGGYPHGVDPSPDAFNSAPEQIIYLPVRAIIEPEHFERLQQLLESRNPRMNAAKTVSSPLLLAGVAVCKCNGALTLRTGTSTTGKVHRYYHCSKKNRLGIAGCAGICIPEHLLDDAVMTAVAERVLAPSHLSSLLQKLFDLHTKEEGERDAVLPALRARKAASDKALKGLYATAEAVPEAAEETNYQQNLTNALREAKLVERALQQAESVRAAKPVVTPQKIEAFSRSAKELLHGSNRAIAKQALQSIVVRVEVTDETIRILGENDQLSRLVASEGSDPEDGSDPAPGVRGYVRRWRREWDSLPCACPMQETQ